MICSQQMDQRKQRLWFLSLKMKKSWLEIPVTIVPQIMLFASLRIAVVMVFHWRQHLTRSKQWIANIKIAPNFGISLLLDPSLRCLSNAFQDQKLLNWWQLALHLSHWPCSCFNENEEGFMFVFTNYEHINISAMVFIS